MDEASIEEKLLHYMQYTPLHCPLANPSTYIHFIFIYSIAPGNDTSIIKTCLYS